MRKEDKEITKKMMEVLVEIVDAYSKVVSKEEFFHTLELTWETIHLFGKEAILELVGKEAEK